MKRSSGFGGQKGQGPSGSFTCWWCCRGDDVAEHDDNPFTQCRTALHLACANGHPEVVALLVDRGCQLDVFDNKNRTALLKAVQCQEEECATILLEHGADPDLPDVYGNTTLHYAIYNEDIPMTKKLLLYHANIESANKDELTPFLLAVHEQKQQMEDFLRKQKENLTAVKLESIHQVMSEYKENETPRNPQNSNPVNEIPGNPVKRLFNKPSVDDSRPMSANEDFDFDTEEKATEPANGKRQNDTPFTVKSGQKEDIQSHLDSKKISKNHAENGSSHVSGATDCKTKYVINGQEEEQVLAVISEEEQERLEESENNELQISHGHKKEKDLLHKNCMLQEEVARLRLEIDTVKNWNQQKEKNYLEDIKIVKEKNDFLQNALKLKEETFATMIFQDSIQPEVLIAENKMPSFKLEDKNQNQERLEREIKSYRCRLATAIQDCDQSQASKRDVERDFQRTRQEWFHLKEKMNFDMSNLKDKNELLSEKLSNAENKIRSLKMKWHQTKDALREKTLVLEDVQRDLTQSQCQRKEIEQMFQNEEDKVSKYIQKQESLEERLSQIQNENLLLRQQLDEAYKKADNQEETIINIQEQFNAIVKNQAQSEEQSLLLEQKNNNLINKCDFIKKRLYKYEKEKAERNEIVRQLQQELADTIKKQPISEPPLEATPCYVNLDETQDSKRKSGQIRSQPDLTEAVETASSEGLHVDAEVEVLQQALLYMKTMQEKHETLQKDQEKLEEELGNLKSHMEMNMLECGQLEHYKQEVEERARQEIAEQLENVGLLLQTQKIAHNKLQLLKEESNATMKSQMELRIKDLEFKLYKAKTSQADCNTTELEKYKELYLEELKLRESLSDELNKRKEILADVSTKLLQEKEWSGSLFSSHTTRPVLESACNGNLNENLGLNRIHIPREALRIPTLSSLSSNIRMESDLSKTRTEDTFWNSRLGNISRCYDSHPVVSSNGARDHQVDPLFQGKAV
ncbi:coiled-coil domain-containing protein 144A-like isoform X3 [Pongo pygmaeus]|uniref:coiled-coil domain-containing protein 144A-like isoform X3 n=1 Tax=Pongo pygmaeus TaxID=9600 RepID=UPI0023E0CD1A|nr:coiled-coil domain-containing protein 144A-like isoform X3 [Pongo pygmaeus]